MKLDLTEDEVAALRRIEAGLELDLEDLNPKNLAGVALVEEEVELVRELLIRAEAER